MEANALDPVGSSLMHPNQRCVSQMPGTNMLDGIIEHTTISTLTDFFGMSDKMFHDK
jgi:hypothetical protein